jgi:hypothetical protein
VGVTSSGREVLQPRFIQNPIVVATCSMDAKQEAAEKARCEKFRDYAIQGASQCSA